MNRPEICAQIDRIEREMTAEWGKQGQRQLAAVQERCMRARERLVRRRSWRQRLHGFVECVVAALSAAQLPENQ